MQDHQVMKSETEKMKNEKKGKNNSIFTAGKPVQPREWN
jgi:hypothetical protein